MLSFLKHYFRLVFLLMLINSNSAVLAQFSPDYTTFKLDAAKGLQSTSMQKAFYLDKDGFLWYGSYNAIIKHTGATQIKYPVIHPDPKIKKIYIQGIKQIEDNTLLCTTDYGFFKLNMVTGVSQWKTPKYANSREYVNFCSIYPGRGENIWLKSHYGLIFRYNKASNTIKQCSILNNFNLEKILDFSIRLDDTRIQEAIGDSLLITCFNNLYIVTEKEIQLAYSSGFAPQNKAQRMHLTKNGLFFPENASGTYSFEGKSYTYTFLPEINRQIISCPYNFNIVPPSYTEEQPMFLAYKASRNFGFHFFKFRYTNGQYELIRWDNIPFSETVFPALINPSGFYLVNTGESFYKIRSKNAFFKNYLNKPEEYALIEPISTRAIVEDSKGTIYVSTYSGFFKKKKKQKNFSKVKFSAVKGEKKINPIPNSYNIYLENDSTLWALGYYRYLFKINLKKNTFRVIEPLFPSKNKFCHYVEIKEIGDNKVLLGGICGLQEFDLITEEIRDINYLNKEHDLSGKLVYDFLLTSSKDKLWIATKNGNGLYQKDVQTEEVVHYHSKSPDTNTQLINDFINVLFEDSEENIWIGTENGIQKVFSGNKAHPTSIDRKQDFPNNNIVGILEDANKELWVSSYNGLSRVNKGSGFTTTYYKEDGLPDSEFNKKAFRLLSDSSMFFGGLNGYTRFNPESLPKSKAASIHLVSYTSHIDSLDKIGEQTFYLDDIQDFVLGYQRNYLKLSFAINDIFSPKKHTYQYKLPKIRDEWVTMGSNNELELIGLSPGEYNLQIRGISSKGAFTNTLEYTILSEQIFYKKTWFVLSALIFISGLLVIWYLLRKKNQRLKLETESEIHFLKSKSLRSMMNPHFLNNVLNSIQSVLFLKGELEANRFIGSFSKLLRHQLDFSNEEYILLSEEISYLKHYIDVEKTRSNKSIQTSFDIDPNIDMEMTRIPSVILQPLVENALLHGFATMESDCLLKIIIRKKSEYIHVVIEDNGIGIEVSKMLNEKRNKQHKSAANHILSERIKLNNKINSGKMHVSFGKAMEFQSGTRVEIRLPMK